MGAASLTIGSALGCGLAQLSKADAGVLGLRRLAELVEHAAQLLRRLQRVRVVALPEEEAGFRELPRGLVLGGRARAQREEADQPRRRDYARRRQRNASEADPIVREAVEDGRPRVLDMSPAVSC